MIMHLAFDPAYLLKPHISLQYSNQNPSQKAYFHFIKIMLFDFIQMNQGNNEVLGFLPNCFEHQSGQVHYFNYSKISFLSGNKCSSTAWKKIAKDAKIMTSRAICLTIHQVLVHLGHFLNYLLKLSEHHLWYHMEINRINYRLEMNTTFA